MKLPLTWLKEYCDPGLTPEELAVRLAMTGTEVERIERHGVSGPFVVGKVLTAEQHPDADRLRVCTVDVGDTDAQTIVCGAPNVAAGQTVAVARPGAVMPDGTKLGKAKLRGIESHGMILAEDEVGLGTDHAGIMVLDDAHAAGTSLFEVLPIDETVLELEITPNRPDCLGVYGVAREAHAATGAQLKPPPWAEDPHPAGELTAAQITVEDPDLCPRFTARVYEDVTIGPSPLWLKGRLIAAGMRPINNVVDITNYVMLLTGQPTHAFDLDNVAGGRLNVRRAREGERMTTLDDIERALDTEMVVIEDADGPTSIAGIMGGQRSEVSETTTRVLFEAATWNGPNINRTMARLNLRSEAGGRFEKQLEPEQAMDAQALAAQLFAQIGATALPGTIDVGGPGPEPAVIRLRDAKVDGLLGTHVERADAERVLESLGFGTAGADDGLDVTVPYWRRTDVRREADVIEEVARLVALDDLPATIPPNRLNLPGRLTPAQRARRRARDALIGTGLMEVVGWSFTSREALARLQMGIEPIALENPMSEEQAVMRTTLLVSLLDAASLNAARGNPPQGFFESGAVYIPRDTAVPLPVHPRRDSAAGPAAAKPGVEQLPAEYDTLSALVPGDFFAAKGHLEALGRALRVELTFDRAQAPFAHPGRAAHVYGGGDFIGWLGEVHPSVAAQWDLGQVTAFELDLDRLIDAMPGEIHYRDMTSFPALRQDIAVVVDREQAAGDVLAAVRDAGGELLADARVFDVYEGEQVPDGKKSMAIALQFRAPDRTLTDEDVEPLRARIVEAVGGQLRA
ncbi:MAG TPA: phenylalanine--tRNA ligase subunit beta [Solirubrobacteraceae bacterium]